DVPRLYRRRVPLTFFSGGVDLQASQLSATETLNDGAKPLIEKAPDVICRKSKNDFIQGQRFEYQKQSRQNHAVLSALFSSIKGEASSFNV
ncbi:MAG: hypothetical protein LIO59_06455, partial [Oscillospiraceae bacterium]|nr:hypothetical protein [Oscillospiraceae bacterium]